LAIFDQEKKKKMKKILIIEDSDDVRENLIDLLEINNFNVISADNGESGYRLATTETPDLIIADIMMPKMDGLELLKLLRDNNLTSAIPFIFLTAKSATIDRRAGMNMGADDYITKPFQAEDVLTAVKIRLEKKDLQEKKFEKVYRSISGNIPHELRTPLVSIIGFTNIMLEEMYDLERRELVDMLLKVKYSSLRLHKTIEKFIVFSESEVLINNKIEHASLLTKKTEIHAFLLDHIISAKMKIEDLELPVNLTSSFGNVLIAEEHFCIMFGELVENAIKFSYPNKPIEISSADDDSTYTLKVKNFGRGMTEDEIKTTAPFLQHNRQIHEQQGNGLGLMIVKRLAGFYDIEFNLTSIIGEYTEATLKFKKN
jgi:two-component system, sensor histidine kinase and response regulator